MEVYKIFVEKVSAKDTNRPQLQAMLNYVQEGDTVYVTDFSRLERIRDNEENYMNNIPVNLHSSESFLFAEYCVSLIDEAVESLEAAYLAH